MAKITVIPSTKNPITQIANGSNELRRVAAYARVSTNTDEQYSSYEAQVNYYMKFIQERPDWTYVNVYADEGITGTNTRRRVEFNKMISDAVGGQIDLIITKSISRFARNTLDTISYVRKLKDKGIEVYFEKENLWTLDPKSELILTIMASIAQEESRSISQNVTWGKRVSFQKGKVSFAYDSFLGYKKENDKLVIDEDQAVIVKMIYRMFLAEGKSILSIAKYLTSQNVKTPTGKSTKWVYGTIQSILTNEKYKGDALLQKRFTDNYLNHSLIKNTGQIPQYYVENNHPAIIDKEMWDFVQIELEKRLAMGQQYSSSDIFASKLICEDCGGFYGKKKWHSNSKYSRFVHQCNRKFDKGKDKCLTPNLMEDDIKLKFIEAYNLTMKDKKRIIQDSTEMIEMLTDTTELDQEIENLNDELLVISELLNKIIRENSKSGMTQDDYNKKYGELLNRYERMKEKHENLIKSRSGKQSQVINLKAFLSNLKKLDDKLIDWNEHIWLMLVNSAIVHRDKSITFKLTNGKEICSL
jgi:site-specific DNA recombinase